MTSLGDSATTSLSPTAFTTLLRWQSVRPGCLHGNLCRLQATARTSAAARRCLARMIPRAGTPAKARIFFRKGTHCVMTLHNEPLRRQPEVSRGDEAAEQGTTLVPSATAYPMGYQWPASRLTRPDMMMLTELRNK